MRSLPSRTSSQSGRQIVSETVLHTVSAGSIGS